MTTTIIVTLCALLLIAYFFDLTSSKTKIPSVILLLLLGWGLRQGVDFFHINIPPLDPTLPILGTIGLILIVLEGSLELEFNKSKMGMVKTSFIGAVVPMFALAFVLAYAFYYFGGNNFKDSLLNAIPFCVISSSIAIPSVRNISKNEKDFVIYESSLSDIIGVTFFNFIALNAVIGFGSFVDFIVQILLIFIISLISTVFLAFLLSKIENKIKFFPIILFVILIYEISKIFHLPALIFILMFGLTLGNLDEIKRIKWFNRFDLASLNKEVHKFLELTMEATFMIRSLFFLVFGFLMKTSDIINLESLKWSGGIVLAIFAFRAIQIKLSKLPFRPLLFVAPRGLITILLCLSIAPAERIDLVNNALIIQVIILTAIMMMIGLMITKQIDKKGQMKKEMQDAAETNVPLSEIVVEEIN